MTTNFYASPSDIRNDRVVLSDEEARHVRSVLRAEKGEEIVVVDGEGGWYRVQIDHLAPQQVVGTIVETRHEVGEPEIHLTVGLGMLKKRSRFETFVEKAVELGVRRIVPLRTQHSEVEEIREDRLRRVMVAAMKQCRRSRLPVLDTPQSLAAVLNSTTAECQLLCHGGESAPPLPTALDSVERGTEVLTLVGPEGGFAAPEVEAARTAGCTLVSLGERRLRAETAGIIATNAVLIGPCGNLSR